MHGGFRAQTDRVSQCWELFPSSALGKSRSPRDEAVSAGRWFLACRGAGSGCAGAAPSSVRVAKPGPGGVAALLRKVRASVAFFHSA